MEQAIAKTQARLEKAKEAFLDGIDTLEEYKKNKTALLETLQALEQKKGTPPPPEASLSSLSLCAMLQMDSFSPAEKRAAFCSAVEKVVFHKAERRISLILSAE